MSRVQVHDRVRRPPGGHLAVSRRAREDEAVDGGGGGGPADERGADARGSTFEIDIKEGRKVVTYQGEVTKYDQNKLMGVKMVGGCGKTPMTMYADYHLTDLGDGRTRMDYTCRAEVQSFWFKLLMPLFKLFGKGMIKKFMRNLRGLVEGPTPQPTAS